MPCASSYSQCHIYIIIYKLITIIINTRYSHYYRYYLWYVAICINVCICVVIFIVTLRLVWIDDTQGAHSPGPRTLSMGVYPIYNIRSQISDMEDVSSRHHEVLLMLLVLLSTYCSWTILLVDVSSYCWK